jgi:hypothetical protein
VFFNHALPMPPGLSGVPENALQKVKEALGLSDVQVTAVQTLLNMRNESKSRRKPQPRTRNSAT